MGMLFGGDSNAWSDGRGHVTWTDETGQWRSAPVEEYQQWQREGEFREAWQDLLATYGALARAIEHGPKAVEGHARKVMAAKLVKYDLLGDYPSRLGALLAITDPTEIVEALAPRSLLAKPVGLVVGRAVTADDEADYRRIMATQRMKLSAIQRMKGKVPGYAEPSLA